MTTAIDAHMQEIKARQRSRDEVVDESRAMLHRAFDQLEAHGDEIGRDIMGRTVEELILGPCPVCDRDLRLHHVRSSQFIGCNGYPECRFNIGLPATTWGFAIRTDDVCATHGLAHVRLLAKGARPWDIGCPLCHHISLQPRDHGPDAVHDAEPLIERLNAAHVYAVNEVAAADPADARRDRRGERPGRGAAQGRGRRGAGPAPAPLGAPQVRARPRPAAAGPEPREDHAGPLRPRDRHDRAPGRRLGRGPPRVRDRREGGRDPPRRRGRALQRPPAPRHGHPGDQPQEVLRGRDHAPRGLPRPAARGHHAPDRDLARHGPPARGARGRGPRAARAEADDQGPARARPGRAARDSRAWASPRSRSSTAAASSTPRPWSWPTRTRWPPARASRSGRSRTSRPSP